uniref:F-box domain-containing protein n=1 Tax=Tetranychus urticae TaxID=32264 RepID=A0A158P4M2_TETUR
MLINELPDDCLLTIFDYIQDLEDLINCFEVCEKWSNLIVARNKKVKYFIDRPNYSPDSVTQQSNKPIDVTFLSKWFPNLKIANLSYPSHVKPAIEDIDKLIRNSESLKGIICGDYLNLKLMPQKANLEMLSTRIIDSYKIEINETVKQLNLWNSTLDEFKEVAHCFPNLERLKISCSKKTTDFYSDGPVMANLKIVELAGSSRDRDYHECCSSFLFMDSCPALQSAHIKIDCSRIVINYSVKNANLQDLVIQNYKPTNWEELPMLMSKYPNLKHLSLRKMWLGKKHIEQLILILPKLILLDIRQSHKDTRKTMENVQDYCKQHGRSIKFYFKKDDKQIKSDWPQSLNRREKICRGFDFMEHCFFKSFDKLPHFLDPIDE